MFIVRYAAHQMYILTLLVGLHVPTRPTCRNNACIAPHRLPHAAAPNPSHLIIHPPVIQQHSRPPYADAEESLRWHPTLTTSGMIERCNAILVSDLSISTGDRQSIDSRFFVLLDGLDQRSLFMVEGCSKTGRRPRSHGQISRISYGRHISLSEGGGSMYGPASVPAPSRNIHYSVVFIEADRRTQRGMADNVSPLCVQRNPR